MTLDKQALQIDAAGEYKTISSFLMHEVRKTFRRRGAVVGISGGIDSSVVLALCARTFGPERVRAVMMPERDSDPASEVLARRVARHYGVEPVLEDLTHTLEGLGCYCRRDEAIRRVFPEYDAGQGYRAKITLPPNLLDEGTLNVFSMTVLRPDGSAMEKPLPPEEFRQIEAASNLKQRARMAMLYYHAELRNFAVVGTTNKNEHGMGFFVKYGDGGVDVQPIAHLFKSQIYQLADFLDVPAEVKRRTPTTDTYSAPASQEEFFYRLPFDILDRLWFAMENSIPIADVSRAMNLSEIQIRRAYQDFECKRRSTEYVRMQPVALSTLDTSAVVATAQGSRLP